MTKECKQQFTLRITQANKTEMIVILYEILLTYVSEAKDALEKEDREGCRAAVRKIRSCLAELTESLHLEYELAGRLLSLYLYCNRELVRVDVRGSKEALEHVQAVVENLLKAYRELAKMDESEPVMQNSQTVYAGLTYGKNLLSEDMTQESANRGFRA